MEHSQLYSTASRVIPGGVNSPARAFTGLDRAPVFIRRAEGPYLYDEEGNRYIDYVLSWGPMILGHCHRKVVKDMEKVLHNGTSFGAPTELETKLAEKIVSFVPSIEKVRMVNSGTEATMSAARLARGYTGCDKVIKMVGCYHGHNDSFLVQAGSGPATAGVPDSPGVPESFSRHTINVPFNDQKAVEKAFTEFKGEIAAVILEPVAGNMGVIPPQEGYLEFLRKITAQNQALLIFDEVITGFRVARGGAQQLYGINPDLTCLGKIIGGGLPVGAYGGKKEIMDYIAPDGPVYQAGTLSGNPLAVRAGLTTLEQLADEDVYQELKQKTNYLVSEMKKIANRYEAPVSFNQVPGLFSQFFRQEKVTNYETADQADRELFNQYFLQMLNKGVYLAPSPFESTFLSLAHGKEILNITLNIYEKVIKEIFG